MPHLNFILLALSSLKISDIPPINSMLEWRLCIEVPSLAYAAKANSRQVIFSVDIPYPLLKLWQECMVIQKLRQQTTEDDAAVQNDDSCPCQSNDLQQPNLDYFDLFEYSIPGNSFGITNDKGIRSEVNTSLRKIAGLVNIAYSKAKSGRKRIGLQCEKISCIGEDGNFYLGFAERK